MDRSNAAYVWLSTPKTIRIAIGNEEPEARDYDASTFGIAVKEEWFNMERFEAIGEEHQVRMDDPNQRKNGSCPRPSNDSAKPIGG